MKIFLKKTLFFTALLLFGFGFLLTSSSILVNTFAKFKTNDKVNIVVLGHSHSQSSIDDREIENVLNASKWGQSYFYAKSKIRRIIEHNPQIELVLLEFSNLNLMMDFRKHLHNNRYIQDRLPRHLPYINTTEFLQLFKLHPIFTLESSADIIKQNATLALKYDFNCINKLEGYTPITRDILKKEIHNLQARNFIFQDNELYTDELIYLQEIINYCQSKNVHFALIRSPQYYKNPQLRNEHKLQEILNNNYPDLPFLDFTNMFQDESCYADFSHTNIEGAKRFTKYLKTELFNLPVDSILTYKSPFKYNKTFKFIE